MMGRRLLSKYEILCFLPFIIVLVIYAIFINEFGWKERMRVATNYALVLKILTMKKLDLIWSCDDILIDEISNESLILLLSKDVLQVVCLNFDAGISIIY
ncbi:hypothetical protein P3L10_013926 [Capsicum annuum]